MTRRAAAIILGLAAALAVAPAAPAQRRLINPAQPERSPFLDGTHAFRHVLKVVGRNRIEPLSPIDLAGEIKPERTLIVVLGDPAPLDALNHLIMGGFYGFVRNGGALLIATDHRTPTVFGVQVNGTQVLLPGGGFDAYRGMAECPLVEPRQGAQPPLFEPPLGLERNDPSRKVAGNLPSYLVVVVKPDVIPVLADLPKGSTMGRAVPFAAGGAVGSGRVLVMADQDVFINEMMLQRDNGNIQLTYRLADWLLTRPGTQADKRDRVLFYEDSAVQTNFDIPLRSLPPPPIPPPDTLRGMLDELLPAMEREGFFAQLEDDNVADKAIEEGASAVPLWRGAGPEWKMWTVAAILASVGVGLYGFVRLGMFRYRAEAAGPTLTELLQQQPAAGAVMAQRQEAMLRGGNLGEPARDLARRLFSDAGLSPGAGPPRIEVSGPWWRRWATRLRWRRLWRLAHSGRPVRVSPRGFARLARRVAALRAALADGSVRIN
jgi:hypothetical protein